MRTGMEPALQGPPQDAIEILGADSLRLSRSLEDHIRRHFSPDQNKTLRLFPASEVADLLGVTTAHLRTMRYEGKLPDGIGSEDGSRRGLHFSAEEIYQIRCALEERSRKKHRYLPMRGKNDKLRVIAISSFKGGSGKSTLASHLAASMSLMGYRVLLVDCDPQASLSTIMGIEPDLQSFGSGTIYDAIRFENVRPLSEVIRKTFFHNISIASAGLLLAEFEQYAAYHARESIDDMPWFSRLAIAINSVEDQYDIVLIDCPPSLGFLTLSALFVANALIIPVVPNMIDVASLAQYTKMTSEMMDVLREFGASFNHDFIRYTLTRHEPVDAPQAQLAAFLRVQFEERVMASTFLKSTVVADAGMTNQTLYEINRSDVTRSAYDRARESIDAVSSELHGLIQKGWGRS